MWNLNRPHFWQPAPSDTDVQLFYANAYAYRKDAVMYPICYIGMSPEMWRTVMRTGDDDVDLSRFLHAMLRIGAERYGRQWTHAAKAASPQWYYDQIVFGEAIEQWSGHPSRCHRIDRAPAMDRVDRGRWQFNGNLQGKIDAHLVSCIDFSCNLV